MFKVSQPATLNIELGTIKKNSYLIKAMILSEKNIFDLLSSIPDPEIPVISINDLGILREVLIADGKVKVRITPTYTGCPAMKAIENEIKEKLVEAGVQNGEVELVYSPVWTTDWINDDAKERLRKYGIAPPLLSSRDKNLLSLQPKKIACPHCGSVQTEMISAFGSTACKALYKCKNCLEPFDYFKCH